MIKSVIFVYKRIFYSLIIKETKAKSTNGTYQYNNIKAVMLLKYYMYHY